MLIEIHQVPRAPRRDVMLAWLRASIWAQVEGRPYCLLTRP